MILGQRKTGYSRYQGDCPTADSHRDCVECAYPLLVNLKQGPEMFYCRWLLSMRVRFTRLLGWAILNRLIRSLVACIVRTADWLAHL